MNQQNSQNDGSSPPDSGRAYRLLPIASAIILAIALVGFLRGIAEPEIATTVRQVDPPGKTTESENDVPHAVAYKDMAMASFRANRDWSSSLKQLQFPSPGMFDLVERTPEMKTTALADRTRTRAYEGAPPVIPHPVEQQSAASCLACHGKGVRLGDRVAAKISHPHYSSCTQCHVEFHSGAPFDSEPIAENEFRGLERSGVGDRVYAGAPPTIPHTLWMRNDCLSCHGLIARPGLRTTHPWLSNCVQCHASSAELNHVPFAQIPESTHD